MEESNENINFRKESFKRDSYLIQEELVRQINKAERWSTVMSAWNALLKVQLMANKLIKGE